jgi:hypothetical protein
VSEPEVPVHDPLAPVVEALLACLVVRLEQAGAPVCRAFWHPGATAPWDACGESGDGAEGQAWIAVPRVFPSDNFPTETANAHRCIPMGYGVELVVGVLRCASTVDSSGQPPSSEAVSADALKVSRDRHAVLESIVCCLFGDDPDPGNYRLGAWEALGPDGGCVGGQWRVQVALPACRCPGGYPPEPPPTSGFGIDPFGTSSFGG